MLLNDKLQNQIRGCIQDLNDLVNDQGYALTDPPVMKKSMELDELILQAMRSQSLRRKNAVPLH
ncbi:aspartyl-phosphate phosphatase Spo0E family protein [Paenibacillus filicis]|uniref:Aspartyl-phosphate phosphatase Spo0E family protein n=1 Tax=Paenibacillus gyeongsangnamensis TaxID=3388067 RepID=A0ABT4QGB9_9BACL|nr:aspartyl-phosphate phosphatase Spo0E family protein [Paenibacillus filicis]MCZ8515897.1 aspartyl-phosphate phosphatase Spo0E family protein [Paenibacillus filicis]